MKNQQNILIYVSIITIMSICIYYIYKYQILEEVCEMCATSKQSNIKIYNFNTSTCPASKEFQLIWDKFSKTENSKHVNVIDVKCDDPKNEKICTKYEIDAVPTVILEKGTQRVPFNGPRTVDNLISFINAN
jgi:thioredoxin-like negative regulator of GroEL